MATSVHDKPKKGRNAESKRETDAANIAMAIQQSLAADQRNDDFDSVREKNVRRSNVCKEYRPKDLRDAQAEIKWQQRKPYDGAAKRRAAIQEQLEQGRGSASDTDSSGTKKAAAAAQKENDARTRQPVWRSRSAAKNAKKTSDRDRTRRAQRTKGGKSSGVRRLRTNAKRSKSNAAALKKAVAFEIPTKNASADSEVPTKLMSRLQIGQKDNGQHIQKGLECPESTSSINCNKLGSGGNRISEPAGSKDLASKRAAYFESLLKKQE